MLYNIPCRIYILSILSLCISGIVSTATATSSETKISNEETLVVTTNRSASNLWESPATIQVIDQQTLQNSTNASIADNLQDRRPVLARLLLKSGRYCCPDCWTSTMASH